MFSEKNNTYDLDLSFFGLIREDEIDDDYAALVPSVSLDTDHFKMERDLREIEWQIHYGMFDPDGPIKGACELLDDVAGAYHDLCTEHARFHWLRMLISYRVNSAEILLTLYPAVIEDPVYGKAKACARQNDRLLYQRILRLEAAYADRHTAAEGDAAHASLLPLADEDSECAESAAFSDAQIETLRPPKETIDLQEFRRTGWPNLQRGRATDGEDRRTSHFMGEIRDRRSENRRRTEAMNRYAEGKVFHNAALRLIRHADIQNHVLCRYHGTEALVVIPAEIEQIAADAFDDCTSIRWLVIRNPAVIIDPTAFSGCPNLAEVSISQNTPIAPDTFPEGCHLTRH